jgi:hypothetical protein
MPKTHTKSSIKETNFNAVNALEMDIKECVECTLHLSTSPSIPPHLNLRGPYNAFTGRVPRLPATLSLERNLSKYRARQRRPPRDARGYVRNAIRKEKNLFATLNPSDLLQTCETIRTRGI